ncbi:hypothetical protein [Gluconobacter kanchanaburiensis]|nr:hypothetical protein [Gluconobacter kanchanaburiensis]MBF0860781.1 hypothetical protein [Gluconobacter kanchanaburiensis]GBR69783.1 hypothetical protein AA103587_1517 [Gluconobacter kanchanaburiensis NBRC 103587]
MAIPLGVWLLGRGRSEGISCFAPGAGALLAALAPTIALAVIGVWMAFMVPSSERIMGLTRAVVPLVCTLLQLVVSELYARMLNRTGLWSRYATASLWCGWLPLAMLIVAQGVLHLVLPGTAVSDQALAGLAFGAQLYTLWLTWYVTRVGLVTTGWQAFVMTALQTAPVGILLWVLWLLPPHYNAVVDLLGLSS